MRPQTWIAMVLAVGLLAPPARADEDVFNAESDVRFKEGVAFTKAHQWEQCRAAFLQTLAVAPGDAMTLLNLAICEQGGGHDVEALGHLKEYLVHPKRNPKIIPELKETTYEELWQATGHLRISADRGEVLVLDNVKIGNAPLADVVDVKPGTHRLEAGARSVDITVAAGEMKDVDLASPAPAQALVTPPPKEEKESYWTNGHIAGVTAGGLAVVAAGVGVGFLLAHNGHSRDAQSTALDVCAVSAGSACRQYVDARDRAKTAATISTVSFVAAGALAVGAGILLWPRHEKGAHATARIVPTGQGILVEGAF